MKQQYSIYIYMKQHIRLKTGFHGVILYYCHLHILQSSLRVTLYKCITVTYTPYRHHSQCHTVLLPLTHLTVFITSVILILYYHHLHIFHQLQTSLPVSYCITVLLPYIHLTVITTCVMLILYYCQKFKNYCLSVLWLDEGHFPINMHNVCSC